MIKRGRIHPATKTFQALRIATNDELTELKNGIKSTLTSLCPSGKLGIITFHSLEDRIVKNAFREVDPSVYTVLTKKPITATDEEIKINPRSRSAKLRIIKKNESTI